MGTLTANYSFQKPTDGLDDDVWGNDYVGMDDPETDPSPGLNGNWSKADILLQKWQDRLDVLDAALSDVPQQIEDAQVKVGQIICVTWSGNPATVLGYGTWQQWEPGRTLVGVGDNGERNWTLGLQTGEELVQLANGNLPAHVHTVNPPVRTSTAAGGHNHTGLKGAGTGSDGGPSGSATNSTATNRNTSAVGDHTHNANVAASTSSTVGSNQPHNNVQPSKAAHIWQRIS